MVDGGMEGWRDGEVEEEEEGGWRMGGWEDRRMERRRGWRDERGKDGRGGEEERMEG